MFYCRTLCPHQSTIFLGLLLLLVNICWKANIRAFLTLAFQQIFTKSITNDGLHKHVILFQDRIQDATYYVHNKLSSSLQADWRPFELQKPDVEHVLNHFLDMHGLIFKFGKQIRNDDLHIYAHHF